MNTHEKFELGECYEVELADGKTIRFRALGGNPIMVELPPDSGNKVEWESLYQNYRSVKKIACPKK